MNELVKVLKVKMGETKILRWIDYGQWKRGLMLDESHTVRRLEVKRNSRSICLHDGEFFTDDLSQIFFLLTQKLEFEAFLSMHVCIFFFIHSLSRGIQEHPSNLWFKKKKKKKISMCMRCCRVYLQNIYILK